MAQTKELIPDFMLDNPNDSFVFLMPLGLKPDLKEDIGNSYFNVIVQNLTKKKIFETYIPPELFFTHYRFHQVYKNGKINKYEFLATNPLENKILIDTRLDRSHYDVRLDETLTDDMIIQLIGGKNTYLERAKAIGCCFLSIGRTNVIIPHYAIASYYYFRSTLLREATLRCRLDNLYLQAEYTPENASILVPHYVTEDDAPFIHRFLYQPDAIEAFERIGTYLLAYISKHKNNPQRNVEEYLPIKAKFPQRGKFSIWVRYSALYEEMTRSYYHYIHEIVNDDSEIGFSKFTTFYPSFNIILDGEDLKNLPKITVQNPSNPTSRLNPIPGNKKYKQNTVVSKRKKPCASLDNVERSKEKLTLEDFQKRLTIIDEILVDDTVDQSGMSSKDGENNNVQKCKVSAKGARLLRKLKEYTSNFHEFQQYMAYLETQKEVIQNLVINDVQKMKIVLTKEEKQNPKCILSGREREYITATFTYHDIFVGLLELENVTSASTWVISSKMPLKSNIFDQFLDLYIEKNYSIDAIKKMHNKDNPIRFETKNHEKSQELVQEDLIRWAAGVLGKVE